MKGIGEFSGLTQTLPVKNHCNKRQTLIAIFVQQPASKILNISIRRLNIYKTVVKSVVT